MAADIIAPIPIGAEGYFVSLVGRKPHRRLHYLGKCHRMPGVHYLNFIQYGLDAPDEMDYDEVCKQCWPEAVANVDPDSENEMDDDGIAYTEDEEES